MNALLAQYAIERLLDRISRSSHSGAFVLKGAMLFRAWSGELHRPTRDVDLLGHGDPSPAHLAGVFAQILREVSDAEDGLVFDAENVTADETREGQEYGGVRLRIPAALGNARVVVQVDVGFGDAITPDATEREFPTLLGHTAPRVRAYPPETVIAEKLEAICSLGMANSRMKDFYDVIVISRRFKFVGDVLARAIEATFERRGTMVPQELPAGLSDRFGEDGHKQGQWAAFRGRLRIEDAPEGLAEAVRLVREFLLFPLQAAASGAAFKSNWTPRDGWQPSGDALN